MFDSVKGYCMLLRNLQRGHFFEHSVFALNGLHTTHSLTVTQAYRIVTERLSLLRPTMLGYRGGMIFDAGTVSRLCYV